MSNTSCLVFAQSARELEQDRARSAAFAVDFLCWLHQEAAPILSAAPSLPSSTTPCPPQQSPAPEPLRGGAEAGSKGVCAGPPLQPRRQPSSLGPPKALFLDDDFPALAPPTASAAPANRLEAWSPDVQMRRRDSRERQGPVLVVVSSVACFSRRWCDAERASKS